MIAYLSPTETANSHAAKKVETTPKSDLPRE
jgi:hypothetical protein